MDTIKTTYKNTSTEPFYVGGAAASVSADGRILVTPNGESVVVTNLSTHEACITIPGDGEAITSVVITPDGSYVAILTQSQLLRVFKIDLDDAAARPHGQHKISSPVYMSASDSTSTLFAFGGSDGVVTVWDIESGYVTHSLKGHGTTICSLAFYGNHNDSQWRLASGDTSGTVKIWDLVKRKCAATISEHNTAVRGLGFNEDGSKFISAGRDSIAVIYSVGNNNKYKPVNTYPVHEQVECAGFLTIGSRDYFYIAGTRNVLRVFDAHDGQLVAHTEAHLATNEELVIIDATKLIDDALMLVVSDQTCVFVSAKDIDSRHGDDQIIPVILSIAGNHGIIADVRYCGPNSAFVALATNSPALRVVDLAHPLLVKLYEGHTDLLNAIDASEDGMWIATASKDNTARLWRWDENAHEFMAYATFRGHADQVTAVALAKTGAMPAFIITGSSDLTVKKWRVPSGPNDEVKVAEFTRRAHEKDINAIDIAPNDEYFALASYDKLGKIWDSNLGETVGVLKGHKRGLWDINFYKYDKLVCTSSGDKTCKVWLLNDYSCTKTFEGHTNAVQRAKFFNKQSPQVVTAGAEGLVKVWEYKSGELVKTLDNHDNRIWALTLKDDDGQEFLTADADGKITEWLDDTHEQIRLRDEQSQARVEQEQNLSNLIHTGDWANAFLLALTLDHSMRVYNVIRSCIEANTDPESAIGLNQLEATISQLEDAQLINLMRKVRDWNVNFKLFEVSQLVLEVITKKFSIGRLTGVKGLNKIIEQIVPYNERHYTRLDELVEESYILDYAIEQMDQIAV